jgi:hypothetical protein
LGFNRKWRVVADSPHALALYFGVGCTRWKPPALAEAAVMPQGPTAVVLPVTICLVSGTARRVTSSPLAMPRPAVPISTVKRELIVDDNGKDFHITETISAFDVNPKLDPKLYELPK